MNQDVKKLWIDALNSGEYEQGQQYLCNDNKYCCLGVLCDLAEKAGLDIDVLREESNASSYRLYDNEYARLPEKVMKWSGINQNYGRFYFSQNPTDDPLERSSLAYQNDTGKSFSEIAKIIEEYF